MARSLNLRAARIGRFILMGVLGRWRYRDASRQKGGSAGQLPVANMLFFLGAHGAVFGDNVFANRRGHIARAV